MFCLQRYSSKKSSHYSYLWYVGAAWPYTSPLFYRSYKNHQHTRLLQIQDRDQRLPRVLRVLVIAQHHVGAHQDASCHVSGTVLQHYGVRGRKNINNILFYLLHNSLIP